MGEVEEDEGSYLGLFLKDLRIRVDEQRAGDRIGAIIDGRLAGFNTLHTDSLEGTLILVIVGEAKVTNGVWAAFHTLNEDVVIFRELRAGGTKQGFFASGEISLAICIEVQRGNHNFVEVIERAAVSTRPVDQDRLSREGRIDLIPGGDLCGEDLAKLFFGESGDEIV